MSGSGLGITMINMYCDLLDQEFKPVIAMLTARTDSIKQSVERKVKKDLGVYDLAMKKTVLKEQIKEIDEQIKKLSASEYTKHHGSWTWVGKVTMETDRRLAELNAPLEETTAMLESFKKGVKLSCAPAEVAALFAKITPEIKEMTERFKALPPIYSPELLDISPEEAIIIDNAEAD